MQTTNATMNNQIETNLEEYYYKYSHDWKKLSDAFCILLNENKFDEAKIIINKYKQLYIENSSIEFFREDLNDTICNYIKHGDIEIVRWFIKYFGGYINLKFIFECACRFGNINVAKLLSDIYPDFCNFDEFNGEVFKAKFNQKKIALIYNKETCEWI